VDKINSAASKMREIQLASAAHKIISHDNAIAAALKMKSELGADKPTPAGN
jgi:hypothetical protein